MSNEKKQILEMLAQGKITVQEAESLLSAVGENPQVTTETGTQKEIKFLRISVDSTAEDGDKVNIKIPIKFLKAGLKFTAFLPDKAYDKVNDALEKNGFPMDLKTMKNADFTELIQALSEMDIHVQDKQGETVRIFCE
ncbi:SHOCT-like domain-containing protein [Bdellovibrio sp. HCB337]|uniref:SHOCT-like domain-containing protein n=1 Tax=Bdellovibrio sp. HCB337 TaxID=3394358 RepID=UPI0039A5BD19